MSGPWEDYKPVTVESGPWEDFAPGKSSLPGDAGPALQRGVADEHPLSTSYKAQALPAPPKRGFFGDTGAGLVGGAVDTVEQFSRAARAIDWEGGVDVLRNLGTKGVEFSERVQSEHPDIFQPSEAAEQGYLRRSWYGGVRSFIPSVAAGAPGALVGAVGGIPGAIGGFAASGGTIFGLAEYDRFLEEAKKAGVPDDVAHSQAVKAGVWEGGWEAGSDAVDLLLLKMGKPLTQPFKSTVKEMLKGSLKAGLKTYGKVAAAETATEMVQEAGGAKFRQDVGMETVSPGEAAVEAIGPSLVMSGLFMGGGSVKNSFQKAALRRSLTNPEKAPEERTRAAEAVSGAIARQRPDLAKAWMERATEAIQRRQPISLTEDITRLGKEEPVKSPVQSPIQNQNDFDEQIRAGINARPERTAGVAPQAPAQAQTPGISTESVPRGAEDVALWEKKPSELKKLSDQAMDGFIAQATNRARQAGVADEGLLSAFTDDFIAEAQSGKNKKKTAGEIFGEVVKDYLPEGKEVGANGEEGKQGRQLQGRQEGREVLSEPALKSKVDEAAHEAATSPLNDLPEPTEAQKQAGNYKKAHVNVQGLDISIENPKGSERSGVSPEGKRWSTTMQSHYGYLKRTEGADKDNVDVFIGERPESDKVFVVNQTDPKTGKFDEHKALVGFSSEEEARAGYLSNYEKGWKGLGSMAAMSMDEFKAWLKEGDTKRPVKTKDIPEPQGKPVSAKTERGTQVEAKYAVIEAGDLTTSHDTALNRTADYPIELQPRERDRAASELQISRIVSNLEPEFLGESPKASEGAPIVGPDMIVESGNGRTIALKRAYELGHKSAETYRKWLSENADRFGLKESDIKGLKNPVLVRVRQSEVDRVRFVQEANEQSVASMSASEQAKADARNLTNDLMSVFEPNENGEINTGRNRDFIRGFLNKVVPASELGRYITSDGGVSQEGIRRIRNAIFAKAYGDSAALEKLAESTDTNIRQIINVMVAVGPRFAMMEESIRKGELHDLGLSGEIAQAANKLSALREAGQSFEEYLNQGALFDDGISSTVKNIIKIFDFYKRSGTKVKEIFNNYIDAVEGLGSPKQTGLFGDIKPPTKSEVLQAAIKRAEEVDNAQTALWENKAAYGSEGLQLPEEVSGKEGGDVGKETGQHTPGRVNEDEKAYGGLSEKEMAQAIETLRKSLQRYLKRPLPLKIFSEAQMSDSAYGVETAGRIGKVFGKKVVVFHNNRPEIFDFNAVTLPEVPDIIYINDRMETSILAATGHELTHLLKREHPDLYAYFLNSVKDQIIDLDDYRSNLARKMEKEGRSPTEDIVYTELLADFVGDQFAEKAFWERIAQRNPSKFGRLARAVKEFLDGLLEKMQGAGLGSSRYFSDIKRARETAAETFAEYANRERREGEPGEPVFFRKPLTKYHPEYGNDEKNLGIAETALSSTRQFELSFGRGEDTRGRQGWKARKGIRTLGVGITADLARKGYVDLRGSKAETAKDIALISQVYRNPQYETLRLIYMKDGRIVAHEGRTSRLPGTVVFSNAPLRETLAVKERMRRLGADGVWLVHNHPSGNPDPSVEDINFTRYLAQRIPGFKGHVIINSGKYAVMQYQKDLLFKEIKEMETDDRLLQPFKDHPLLGLRIENKEGITYIAQALKTPKGFMVPLYRNAAGVVRAIQEIPVGMANDEKTLTDYLRGRLREFGATTVVIAVPSEGDLTGAQQDTLVSLTRSGVLLDTVIERASVREKAEPGYRPSSTTWMGARVRAMRVAEDSTKNEIESIYDYAVENKSNEKRSVEYGKVDKQEADLIRQKTGLDVEGYKRKIDNYVIRHIIAEHGDPKIENSRGLIAITKEDILKIPEIIATADNVDSAGKTKVGRDAIVHEKRVNGHIYIIEEVRTGKGELIPVTMYKKKATTSGAYSPKGAPLSTPEAFRGSSYLSSHARGRTGVSGNEGDAPPASRDSSLNSNISPSVEDVNKVKESEAPYFVRGNKDEAPFSTKYEDGAILVYFKEKPGDEIRNNLRKNGFKWDGRKKQWWAKDTGQRRKFLEKLDFTLRPHGPSTGQDPVSDAIVQDPKGILDRMRRILRPLGLKDPDMTLLQRLLDLPYWIGKKRLQIGMLVWKTVDRMKERSHLINSHLETLKPYTGLSREQRKDLDRIIVESDMDNELYLRPGEEDDGETAYLQDKAQKILGKPLDEQQVEGYYAWHDTMEQARNLIDEWLEYLFYLPYEHKPWVDRLKAVINEERTLEQAGDGLSPEELNEFKAAYRKSKEDYKTLRKLRRQMGRVRFYMPRNRQEGEFFIRVFDMASKREVWMEKARTQIGANRTKNRLLKEFADGEVKVTQEKALPESLYQDVSDSSAERFLRAAVENLRGRSGFKEKNLYEFRDATFQVVADQFKKRGFGRHQISRGKGQVVGGYQTENLGEVAFQYISGLAGFLTKQKAAVEYAKILEEVPLSEPQTFEYASQYVKDMLRNTGRLDRLSGMARTVAFFWYIAGNPKTATVQFTQNFVTGIPILAQHTKGAGFKYTKAMRDVLLNRTSEEEKKALHEAMDQGIAEAQYFNEQRNKARDQFSGSMQKVLDALFWPFQRMEVFNRRSAFLAMYRVARKEQGLTHESASRKAEEFVYDTHYLMGKVNQPEWARGGTPANAAMSTAYTFKSYMHNYLRSMAKAFFKDAEGKRHIGTVGRSLAALIIIGGLPAVPFLDDLMDELERLAGEPFRSNMRRAMRGVGGDILEKLGMSGIPALIGVDLSGSLKIGLPVSVSDGVGLRLGENALGVYGGLIQKGENAIKAFATGQPLRGAEALAPVFIENPLKAYRMATEGATNLKGKLLQDEKGLSIKTTGAEAARQALGFRPERVAALSQEHRTFNNIKEYFRERRDHLLTRLKTSSPENRQEVMNDIQAFNRAIIKEKLVKSGLRISGTSMRNAFVQKPDKDFMMFELENEPE